MNNILIHHHQSTFYHYDKLNETFEVFFIFSLFLSTISRTVSASLFARLFASCSVLASKFIFVNPLNWAVVIKPVVPGVLL